MLLLFSAPPFMFIEMSPNWPKGYVGILSSTCPAKESLWRGLFIGPGPPSGCTVQCNEPHMHWTVHTIDTICIALLRDLGQTAKKLYLSDLNVMYITFIDDIIKWLNFQHTCQNEIVYECKYIFITILFNSNASTIIIQYTISIFP